MLPRIKTFIWQCLHHSIGVGVCLVQRCLSTNDVCLLCENESETIIHRLRDCPFSKNIRHQLGINSNSNFYEVTFIFGWRKTVSPTSCGINPHGRLFFRFLFGVYGSIETMLSFEIVLLKLTFNEILSLELQNSNTAFLILHAWATRQWCKLDGKSPNLGGFDSTLMVQLLESR